MENENIKIVSIIALIISFMAVVISFGGSNKLGGYTAGHWDSADGYKVDGTTVIDGDGNVDASITSDTGTFSSTLTVTGETNVVNFVQGGGSYSTSSASHVVLTAAQMCDNSYIKVTPTSGAINVTTAATSTLIADCIPAVGDRVSFYFENGATGATTTTIVAGSGVDLIEPSGGDVVIEQNEDAFIEMLNVDGSTIKIFITSLQAADS